MIYGSDGSVTRSGKRYSSGVEYTKRRKLRVVTAWGVDLPAKYYDKDHPDGNSDGAVLDKFERWGQCMVCGGLISLHPVKPRKGSPEEYWWNLPWMDDHLCQKNLMPKWRCMRARANLKRVGRKVVVAVRVRSLFKRD